MNGFPRASVLAAFASDTYSETPPAGDLSWRTDDVWAIGRWIGGYLCVAIRGTTRDGEDILRDIRFLPWWFRKIGLAPAGFGKGARMLIEETTFLVDVADALKAGKLIVVGHSLGGAVALLLGAWLIGLGFTIAAIFAFEPARCGCFKARRLWRKTFVFWTHDGDDEVPRVPPLYLLPPYCTRIGHAGINWFRCHRIATVIADLKARGL